MLTPTTQNTEQLINVSAVQQAYLQHMKNIRELLNRHFYLGLFDLENQFSIHPPGAIYRKQLVQFQGFTGRLVSCTLYLHQDWRRTDGDRLVAFVSGLFWHVVLPAKHERISLTSWFRTRPNEVI